MVAIPELHDYDVSAEHGFLSDEPPLQRLGDPYYEPWEYVMKNLQGLLLSKRLHEVIDRMPVLTTGRLQDVAQWRRAYSILSFMAHAYIWGTKCPREWIPPTITIPFLATCRYLELPPVATYAGLVLWNWKPIFPAEPTDTLANLDMIETFTGSLDEKWFYLISVAIEAKGAALIPLMLDAVRAAAVEDRTTVIHHLREFAECLDALGAILNCMYENCDPHVFYHRLRPFLAGSKNMAQAGLPYGVIFDDGGPMNKQKYVQFSGGSNAQSSLIQFFDIILGVQHRPSEEAKPDQKSGETTSTAAIRRQENFLHDMRRYMPGPHARFLEAVSKVANIREFVVTHRYDRDLAVAFDASLAMLSAFRDKHIQIVSRYIVVKSREAKKSDDEKTSLALRPKMPRSPIDEAAKKKKLVGTGGTSLIPFLQRARDETGEAAIDDWARQLLVKKKQNETL